MTIGEDDRLFHDKRKPLVMLRCLACTEFIEVKQDERKPSVMLRCSACTEFIEVKHDEMKHHEPCFNRILPSPDDYRGG